MTTNQLARCAWKKAKEMGWEAHIQLDCSDVLDMAAVVAFDPDRKRARVARWTEGQLTYSKWVIATDRFDVLNTYLKRVDAYAID